MYDELSCVMRVLAPLTERAFQGLRPYGVPEVDVTSHSSVMDGLSSLLGVLKSSPLRQKDIARMKAGLQMAYMLKKFRFGGDPEARRLQAISGWLARDAAVERRPPLNTLAQMLQARMRVELEKVLPVSDSWLPRFGSGAVFEHDFPLIQRWDSIANWDQGFLMGNIPSLARGLAADGLQVRLCAVPKDFAKDRLITVEPWLRTFVQHGTRRLIYDSLGHGPLKGTAMADSLNRINAAAVHRDLALSASKDRELATFDLSDASDSISNGDVLAVFPPWLHAYLILSRTTSFESESECGEIHMYAGMGNATTFVVETLYFWALARSLAWLCGHRRAYVSVVGDDIIVDEDLARLMLEYQAFESLYLKVNLAKSYWGESSFRESCGMWALCGHNITPVRFDGYDLHEPNGQLGFAEVIRSLVNAGGIGLLCADRLVKHASHTLRTISPLDLPNTPSIYDRYGLWKGVVGHNELPVRFERDLQVWQAKTLTRRSLYIEFPADRDGYLYGALSGQYRLATLCQTVPGKEYTGPMMHMTLPGVERWKKDWVTLSEHPVGLRSRIR